MSGKIKVLEQDIANQIAAGEVAERPTLIVKELIENAIDAGADNIKIFLKDSGFTEMRIIDNGEGIEKADIPTAFLRHSTSKLTHIEDLASLYTMGFRGEALASIAAVAKILLTTKTEAQDNGFKGSVVGGEFLNLEPAPTNTGTEIIVSDLFYNTPARKKFLATPTRELRDISDMVGKIMIAHPHIAIELRNNSKKVFQSAGKGDMRTAIMCIYGREMVKKIIALENEYFSGYISHPSYHKPSRNYYHFYINNRYIQSNLLNKSLEAAYHTLVPQRRFPVAFINIHLDPAEYDINVHPNKLEVKFNKEVNIAEKLVAAVNEALLFAERAYSGNEAIGHKVSSPPQENFNLSREPKEELEAATKSNHTTKPNKFGEDKEGMHFPLGDIPEFTSKALNELMHLDAKEKQEEARRQETKAKKLDVISALKEKEENKIESGQGQLDQTLWGRGKALKLNTHFDEFTKKGKLDLESGFYSSLTILGQLAATFIVAVKEDALYLIDQHAAHERLLFNKIRKAFTHKIISRQPLLIPMELSTNYQQYAWIIENIVNLRDMGFILEEFGDNSFILREVPLWAQDIDAVSFLIEFADGWLKQGDALTTEKILESKIITRACKSAIKANKFLDKSDIHYLFTELDLAEDAFTCPHGRPITIQYGVDEIRRKFLRS